MSVLVGRLLVVGGSLRGYLPRSIPSVLTETGFNRRSTFKDTRNLQPVERSPGFPKGGPQGRINFGLLAPETNVRTHTFR